MRRLVLIRHAKAGPHTLPSEDHERPLAERGRDDAKQLGRKLAKRMFRPDFVLCSTAKRTRQTIKRVNEAFDPPPDVVDEARIYEATPDTLLDIIRTAPGDVETLALVGHNPGFENTVRLLLDEEGRMRWQRRGGAMPTGCAVVLEGAPDGFAALRPGTLRLVDVLVPDDR